MGHPPPLDDHLQRKHFLLIPLYFTLLLFIPFHLHLLRASFEEVVIMNNPYISSENG